MKFDADDLQILRQDFITTLNVAAGIFGEKVFCPFNVREVAWETKPQRAFYDAVMVGLSKRLDRIAEMLPNREKICGARSSTVVEEITS